MRVNQKNINTVSTIIKIIFVILSFLCILIGSYNRVSYYGKIKTPGLGEKPGVWIRFLNRVYGLLILIKLGNT